VKVTVATVCIVRAQYSLWMIHHMSIGVSDIIASGSFYDAILGPLGYSRVFEDRPKLLEGNFNLLLLRLG